MTKPNYDKTSLALAAEALHHEVKHNPAEEGRISDMLSALFNTASRLFATVKGELSNSSFILGFKSNSVYRKVTPANYFDFAEKKVETSPGFSGNLVEYGTFIKAQLDYYKDLDEALTYYSGILGRIINTKAERDSWVDVTARFGASAAKRETQNKDSAKYWAGSREVSLVTAGSLISRVSDLHVVDDHASKIAGILKGYKLKELLNRIDYVNDLAVALSEDLKKGTITGITTAQVNNLSSGILELANQSEHFSVVVYNANVYMRMVENLEATASQIV